MLLFIGIFDGTLFTLHNFLIYFENGCDKIERKVNDKDIKNIIYLKKERKDSCF
ncbi:hypothetical protein Hanom_Chr06g00528281 [Helianthus anomalus]